MSTLGNRHWKLSHFKSGVRLPWIRQAPQSLLHHPGLHCVLLLPVQSLNELQLVQQLNLHLKIFSVENEPMELIQIDRDHRPRHC